jgi:hypothetical protein
MYVGIALARYILLPLGVNVILDKNTSLQFLLGLLPITLTLLSLTVALSEE